MQPQHITLGANLLTQYQFSLQWKNVPRTKKCINNLVFDGYLVFGAISVCSCMCNNKLARSSCGLLFAAKCCRERNQRDRIVILSGGHKVGANPRRACRHPSSKFTSLLYPPPLLLQLYPFTMTPLHKQTGNANTNTTVAL